MGTVSSLSSWRTEKPRYRADVFLTPESAVASDHLAGECAGFDVHESMLDTGMPVPADILRTSHALIVEVRPDQPGTIERLQRLLAERPGLPLLAAVREPSLGDLRSLMRAGVADILPLPLRQVELAQALERLSVDLDRRGEDGRPKGRLICAIKSRGGVGATTILTQIGCILSTAARFRGGPTCLADFDLQFGNAGLYLGQLPEIGLKDLLDARDRLDSAMLKTVLARHPSGLSYLAAPHEVMPLDALTPEQVDPVIALLRREFQTVLVDLPTDWALWSLSTLAESDQVLLVSELSIASLHQAKRQLDFLRQQDLGQLPISVVMNKVSKGLFKTVDFQDAARILGREVAFTIADDAPAVRSSLDQGEPIHQLHPRSRTARDLGEIAAALQAKTAVAH
jgi:pilus assembly protein CpaE